jgi:hypothetical protein
MVKNAKDLMKEAKDNIKVDRFNSGLSCFAWNKDCS